jgi:two-component system, LytTR family, response regulator
MPNEKKIICLAVDDEPPALQVIEKYIAAVPVLELKASVNNAIDASSILQNNKVDLIFLDIQMPQLLGTDFIRSLINAPKVIFTTAFRKYAMDGFELDAVDYLLKPISFERFLKAVNKVMRLNITATENDLSFKISQTNAVSESFIYLRADRKNIKVNFDDILFIESLKDYIKVVTEDKAIITKQAISSIEENLPKNLFIRIHRSFIVSANKIESYTNELIQIGKYELPISRSYRHEVEKILRV